MYSLFDTVQNIVTAAYTSAGAGAGTIVVIIFTTRPGSKVHYEILVFSCTRTGVLVGTVAAENDVTNSVDKSSYIHLTNSSVRCARCNLDVSRLATSCCCRCRFPELDGCSRCVCPAKRTTTAGRFPSLRRARVIYYYPDKRYNIRTIHPLFFFLTLPFSFSLSFRFRFSTLCSREIQNVYYSFCTYCLNADIRDNADVPEMLSATNT